jgi:acyl dehydratase
MRETFFHDDFPVGRSFPLGPTEVTREQVISFATSFDPQPFHLDDSAAAATHFGRIAASGWHVCAMAMRMMCDAYLLDSASLGSPGVDELKWTAPVYPGDSLSGAMTVLDSRVSKTKPHLGLLLTKTELFNQQGSKVMSLQGWAMMRRRQAF